MLTKSWGRGPFQRLFEDVFLGSRFILCPFPFFRCEASVLPDFSESLSPVWSGIASLLKKQSMHSIQVLRGLESEENSAFSFLAHTSKSWSVNAHVEWSCQEKS